MLDLKRVGVESSITWKRWVYLWEKAKEFPTCIGLLHCAFDARAEDEKDVAERLRFFFKLADSHYPTVNRIAVKAFQVLAHNFFRERNNVGELRYHPPVVLQDALDFFRPAEECFPTEGHGLLNLRFGHEESLATEYARSFANRLLDDLWWGSFFNKWPGRVENEDTLTLARSLKPRVIELIYASSDWELRSLVRKDGSYYWNSLDKACFKKLRGLALLKQVGKPGAWRNARSVGEAFINGSSAAELLVLYAATQKELRQ